MFDVRSPQNHVSLNNPFCVINASKYGPEWRLSDDNDDVFRETRERLSCSLCHRHNGLSDELLVARARPRHDWSLHLLTLQLFPQTAPIVGVRFLRPGPRCSEPQTSEPNTMNLQRVGQRAGLRRVNDNHQGVPHGPSLTEKIQSSARSEELFSGASSVLGIPPFVSLYSPFYSRFPPPDRGPQGRYLSHQPLPSVVGSGCKDREVWLCQAKSTECNKGSLPLDASVLSVISLYFSAFPALQNDPQSPYRWSVTSFTLGYIHPRRISLWPRRGFSMGRAPGLV